MSPINRRQFFSALFAPFLAPLVRFLPKPIPLPTPLDGLTLWWQHQGPALVDNFFTSSPLMVRLKEGIREDWDGGAQLMAPMIYGGTESTQKGTLLKWPSPKEMEKYAGVKLPVVLG